MHTFFIIIFVFLIIASVFFVICGLSLLFDDDKTCYPTLLISLVFAGFSLLLYFKVPYKGVVNYEVVGIQERVMVGGVLHIFDENNQEWETDIYQEIIDFQNAETIKVRTEEKYALGGKTRTIETWEK